MSLLLLCAFGFGECDRDDESDSGFRSVAVLGADNRLDDDGAEAADSRNDAAVEGMNDNDDDDAKVEKEEEDEGPAGRKGEGERVSAEVDDVDGGAFIGDLARLDAVLCSNECNDDDDADADDD